MRKARRSLETDEERDRRSWRRARRSAEFDEEWDDDLDDEDWEDTNEWWERDLFVDQAEEEEEEQH